MLERRLEGLEKRYNELSELLARPEVVSDQEQYQKFAKERSDLHDIVEAFTDYKKTDREITEYKSILEGKDEELRELAKEELPALHRRKDNLATPLKLMLLPKDPNDDKSVVVEIRAGAGGDESTLCAAELFRMYCRYAERRNWKVEV